jgi:Putative metal-binding motif
MRQWMVFVVVLLAAIGCDDEVDEGTPSELVQRCLLDPDRDADGWARIECGGYDCDDEDPLRSPSNVELCDDEDRDEDCDLNTPGWDDADNDGYVDVKCKNLDADGGPTTYGTDCDDTRSEVHPGQHELCNDRDDDCDDDVDEGALVGRYVDADGDGYGHGEKLRVCADAKHHALTAGDCDDGNAAIHPDTFRCLANNDDPSAIQLCKPDGTFDSSHCPGGGACIAQPNGTGACGSGCGDDDGGCGVE